MPKITIDQREVEVPPGTTILDAARKLGIEIPTLCFLQGYAPSTSCLACMVKVLGNGRLVPSCATVAEDGMQIESQTEEIHRVRRSALELLLSDHLGDCLAPCWFACPAHMDIPLMLRQIAAGRLREAIVTVKRDIALPAVLGRICPAPCEKACRRKQADGAVAICRLKRFVADADLASDEPYLPACRPATGKRVAIVGAGPAGLAAAYYLLPQGHACTLLDENDRPGGRLLHETSKSVSSDSYDGPPGPSKQQDSGESTGSEAHRTSESQLPRDVLDADIRPILRLGAELRMNTRLGGKEAFEDLRNEFDAVLVACGTTAKDKAEAWGLQVTTRGVRVELHTYETGTAGVFAAGNAIRAKGLVIRSLADGKETAAAIDQYLRGLPVTGPAKPFNTRIGRLEADELAQLVRVAGQAPRRDPAAGVDAGLATPEAAEQATRCLRCDCRASESCKLREYSELYGADPRRYKVPRKSFQQDTRHSEVIFEPGKCIDCGLCIEIARAAGEPIGLTFIGRGFNVRLGVPLDHSLREALQRAAAQCAAACPTGALELKAEG